jgi:hypothetical protein
MTNSYIYCNIVYIILAAVQYVFLKYCTSNKFDETKNYSASRTGNDLCNGEQDNARIW